MSNFGLIPTLELRTYDYEIVYGKTNKSFPSKFIIPEVFQGVVKDQGSVGACVACTLSSLAETFYKMETGKQKEFSEGWAYGALREDASWGYGMIIGLAINYWNKLGQVPKKLFNQLYEMPEMKKIVKDYPMLLEKALPYRIKGWVELSKNPAQRDSQIKDALYTRKYGLIAGSYYFFSEPHCIMIIGWDDEKDSYIYKNSWGENWGNKGIESIPKKEIQEVFLVTDEVVEMRFNDVTKDKWYYNDIKNVFFSGMMKGISDTEFAPEKQLTRAETAVVINRLAKMIDDRFEIVMKDIDKIRR